MKINIIIKIINKLDNIKIKCLIVKYANKIINYNNKIKINKVT